MQLCNESRVRDQRSLRDLAAGGLGGNGASFLGQDPHVRPKASSAMNGVQGGELVEKLQAAYQQQHIAHQASMSDFVNAVASACESFHGQFDGPLMAKVLRGIPSATNSPVPPSAASTSLNVTTDSQVLQRNNSVEEKMISSEFDVADHVMEDMKIKMLPFISAEGKIARPQPLLVRTLGPKYGPKYGKIVSAFNASFEWWQPIESGVLAGFVHSRFFGVCSVLVICANFAFIVAQSDYKVGNVGVAESGTMTMLGHAFTAWFSFELFCNMAVYGKHFLLGADSTWNIFDFVIVTVAWVEIILELTGGSPGSTSFLRILRFLRISRVMRMFIAMRVFKEIKIMGDCLAGSLSIFFFCSVMLALFLSLFAVFFVQGHASYLESKPDVDSEILDSLLEGWGTVGSAMLSLFICATSGDDWKRYFDVLKYLGIQYEILFLLFIDFYMFAFINVVVGVFCEKAVSLAAPTTHEQMTRRYEKEYADAQELFDLLDQHMENPETRQIDSTKFRHFIADPEVDKFFAVRGLKTSSAARFFKMLCDLQQTETVDYPTFVSAVVCLDGSASCIDLHVISVRQLHGIHQMNVSMETHRAEMHKTFDTFQVKVRDLCSKAESHVSGSTSAGDAGLQVGLQVGTQLSAIEAEIKDLKRIAISTPLASRVTSRESTALMPDNIQTPLASSHINTISTFMGGNTVMETPDHLSMDMATPRSDGMSHRGANIPMHTPLAELHSALSQAKFDPTQVIQPGVNEKVLEEKLVKLEHTLDGVRTLHRESSETLTRTEQELGTSKLKKSQLEQLVKLQDSREAELQRQIIQLRASHDQELVRLERSRADLNDQVGLYERRCREMQSEMQKGHLREPPKGGGGGMFDWGHCATPR